jgi:hypothetical protein
LNIIFYRRLNFYFTRRLFENAAKTADLQRFTVKFCKPRSYAAIAAAGRFFEAIKAST